MPRCVPCLGPDIKEAILSRITEPDMRALLGTIPDCSQPREISVCGTRGKRGKSAYNLFISRCMKGKVKSFGQAPEVMKECARQWREDKPPSR